MKQLQIYTEKSNDKLSNRKQPNEKHGSCKIQNAASNRGNEKRHRIMQNQSIKRIEVFTPKQKHHQN